MLREIKIDHLNLIPENFCYSFKYLHNRGILSKEYHIIAHFSTVSNKFIITIQSINYIYYLQHFN